MQQFKILAIPSHIYEDQLQANVCKCIALRSCFKLKDDNNALANVWLKLILVGSKVYYYYFQSYLLVDLRSENRRALYVHNHKSWCSTYDQGGFQQIFVDFR